MKWCASPCPKAGLWPFLLHGSPDGTPPMASELVIYESVREPLPCGVCRLHYGVCRLHGHGRAGNSFRGVFETTRRVVLTWSVRLQSYRPRLPATSEDQLQTLTANAEEQTKWGSPLIPTGAGFSKPAQRGEFSVNKSGATFV